MTNVESALKQQIEELKQLEAQAAQPEPEEDLEEGDPEDLLASLRYQVSGNLYSSSIQDDLNIDVNNLQEEFAEHSRRFAWYSTAFELASAEADRKDAALKRTYAIMDANMRETLKSLGQKFTEKVVEGRVLTCPEYVKAEDAALAAKEMKGLLKAARDAMAQRKDCLVSLGANLRAEMQNDPSLVYKSVK
jgi:hypothetical protein